MEDRLMKILRMKIIVILLLFTGMVVVPIGNQYLTLKSFSNSINAPVAGIQLPVQSNLVGMVGIWNGSISSIPAGWALCDGNFGTPNLTDRFVQSTDFRELPGKTGGEITHNHSYTQVPRHFHSTLDPTHYHSHLTKSFVDGPIASTTTPNPTYHFSYDYGDTAISSDTMINVDVLMAGTDEVHYTYNASELPSFIRMPFIMKIDKNPIIPNGLILFWARDLDTIPEGWIICNGSQGTTDLRDRLVFGTNNDSQIRNIGGNTDHRHVYDSLTLHDHQIPLIKHSHTYLTPKLQFDPVTTAGGAYSAYQYAIGTHQTTPAISGISIGEFGIANCLTDPVSNFPPYISLVPIMKNSSLDVLPDNCIMMWAKDLRDLPNSCLLCDGLKGTPNLFGKFIKCVDNVSEINRTGGSISHNHRYLSVPRHSHALVESPHTHNVDYQLEVKQNVLIAASGAWISVNTQVTMYLTDAYAMGYTDFKGDEYCTTDMLNILPPFYRLSFLMAGTNLFQDSRETSTESKQIAGYPLPLFLSFLGAIVFVVWIKIKRKL